MNASTNRRDFLKHATALLAAGAVGRSASAADDGLGGFKFGVQSYSFRKFNLERALAGIADLGLKYAEFFRNHVPKESTPDQLKAIKKLCADHGVIPLGFGVEKFTKDHEANKKLFDFGQALGITYFSADPDPDSFDSLDKLCEATGIAIAIHPHGPSGKGLHRWTKPVEIMAAVKDHHPKIGTCLDTGHLIRSAQEPFGLKLDPAESIRIMGARNFAMHLKDHDNAKKTDVVYGKGVLDVASVLKALKEVNFTGGISIEYEANPDDPAPDMKACLAVVREVVKKQGTA